MRRAIALSLSFALVAIPLLSGDASAQGAAAPAAPFGGGQNVSGEGSAGAPGSSNDLDNTDQGTELESPSVPNNGSKSEAAEANGPGDAIAGASFPKTVEDPESGLAGIMLENKWRTMSTNLLNSPMALMHMTWQLTEPGVAQGFGNAVAQSGSILQSTYLQKLHESQKDAVLGGEGVARALERMECMRAAREKALKKGQKDNWYTADAGCRGASDITAPSAGSGGATGAAPEEADMTGKSANSKDSPGKKKYKCSDMDPATKFSLVTAYIPERDTLKLNWFKKQDWEPRKLFLETFGDIYRGLPKDASGASSNIDPADRISDVITCVTNPVKSPRYQALELEKELWENFFTLLEARCKASADQQLDNTSYVPFDPAQRNTFWRTNGGMLAGKFDFTGYQFKPATVDIIYGMFIAKELKEVTAEACKARLNPKEPKNNLEFLRTGKTAGSPPEKVRVRQEHRFVFNMLQWIIYGKRLDRVSTWKEWLLNPEKTSLNMAHEENKRIILERVAASVGLPDLDDSLKNQTEANAAEFRRFVGRVNELGASMSGQGGTGLVQSFAAAKDNGSGTMGSGIAGNGN